MSAFVLISGAIYRGPEQRTDKNGRPFLTATLFAKGLETAPWWNIICFEEKAQAELLRLAVGDAVAVQGQLELREYEKDAQKWISPAITVERVLAVRQPKAENPKMDPAAMGGLSQKPAFRPAAQIPEFDDDPR